LLGEEDVSPKRERAFPWKGGGSRGGPGEFRKKKKTCGQGCKIWGNHAGFYEGKFVEYGGGDGKELRKGLGIDGGLGVFRPEQNLGGGMPDTDMGCTGKG